MKEVFSLSSTTILVQLYTENPSIKENIAYPICCQRHRSVGEGIIFWTGFVCVSIVHTNSYIFIFLWHEHDVCQPFWIIHDFPKFSTIVFYHFFFDFYNPFRLQSPQFLLNQFILRFLGKFVHHHHPYQDQEYICRKHILKL